MSAGQGDSVASTKESLTQKISADFSLSDGNVKVARLELINGVSSFRRELGVCPDRQYRQAGQPACVIDRLESGLLLTVLAILRIKDDSGKM